MKRSSPEKRRAYEAARYANDSEYREMIKAKRKAHYEANRELVKARSAERRRTKAREIFLTYIRSAYGISEERWDQMLIGQSGRCAICERPMSIVHIDHCHTDGEVRSLLCPPCNLGLGHFGDDVGRLIRAARYLNRSKMLDSP